MVREPEGGDAAGGRQPAQEADHDDRLIGWKAIAAYLGRDIRTVQRWELAEKLPVHRLEHQRQASAYAFRSELDLWRRRHSIDPEPVAPDPVATVVTDGERRPDVRKRWPLLVGGATLVITTAIALTALWSSRLGKDGRSAPGEDTQNAQAYAAYSEGRALYAARQYKDAIVSLDRAVARDPAFGIAWALLAKAHARLAQPVWAGGQQASARASEAAQRAATLAPNNPDTRIALALSARARGDVAAWRSGAQRAIEVDPRNAEAYALLGDSYAAVVYACNGDQDPEKAEAYYRKAMELAPDVTVVISNRAGNLRRMGRYTDCIQLLDKAVQKFRDEPPLHATRGACRLMQGDVKGAAEDIELLRGNPKMAPAGALIYLGMLDLKLGKVDEGVSELERFVENSPSYRSDLIIAEVYGATGDITRATGHLRKALSANRACADLVDTSLAFRAIRNTAQVKQLLETYGIR
ncbi:MAG: tetratricopeptide repeat protein [Bacteroidales bacterium]